MSKKKDKSRTFKDFQDMGKAFGVQTKQKGKKSPPKKPQDEKRNGVEKDIFPVPEDTRRIVEGLKPEDFSFSLLFSTYAYRWKDDGDLKLYRNKGYILSYMISNHDKNQLNELARSILTRQERVFLSLGMSLGFSKEELQKEPFQFDIKTLWRLVVGLGGAHILETSMTLHHIYGIPVIPGSALKGLVRAYAIGEKFGGDEKTALKDETFVNVFGDQKRSGQVNFFDAIPVGGINFKLDIMNPHYPEYYGGDKPPADWQNPKPLNFLTLEDMTFRFWLLGKDGELVRETRVWLKEGLENLGVGAKTMVGYGYFE